MDPHIRGQTRCAGATTPFHQGRAGVVRSRVGTKPVERELEGDDVALTLSAHVDASLRGVGESWTRRMFELGNRLRTESDRPVHDLSLGNPNLEPPSAWRLAVRELLDEPDSGAHRYMTNAGVPEVRAFIARREASRWGLPVTADDVVMTVGAAGAMNVVLRSLVDPGQSVLVPSPYFSEYGHYCANVSARLEPVATSAEFALDVGAIARSIDSSTRVLILNSPNNPTGAIYDDDSLAALAAVLHKARRSGPPIVVVEDSPYRDLTYDGHLPPSMLRHYPDTIHITSHSKDLGLAGERIGYLIVSPRATARRHIARAAAFCNRVLGFVNAPALMQRALPRVLGQPNGRVDVDIYARRTRRMAVGLRELGFAVPEPRAGFFLFPTLPPSLCLGEQPDVDLTERLLVHRTIVVPGTAFGVPGHLRLSLCVDDDAVEGALAAFRAVVTSATP